MDSVLFLQSLLFILHFVTCFPQHTITVTQTLKDGNFLVSQGNNFALGFFSPSKSSHRRYLGIWFHKVPEITAIWIANRNNPIENSSGVLSIDAQLGLVLYNQLDLTKAPIWSSNVSLQTSETFVAQLLDSGNLILLLERSKRVVWQSFDYPADSLVPGIKLGFDRKTGLERILTSWISVDDPRDGEYSLKLEQSVLPQLLLFKGTERLWRSHAYTWRSKGLYSYNVVDNVDEVVYTYAVEGSSIISRMTMDHLGSFKLLIWHETEQKWKDYFTIPNNWCNFYARCGAYSKCNLRNINFQCTCLPGYEPRLLSSWNMRDGSGGCVRKQMKSNTSCTSNDGFLKVEQVKLPDASLAVWVKNNLSIIDCEYECKRNCSCSAYAIAKVVGKYGGCLAWFGILLDTQEFLDGGLDLYVRVDVIELAENLKMKKRSFLKTKGMIPTLVFSAVLGWLAISAVAYLWIKRRRKRRLLSRSSLKEIFFEHEGTSNQLDLTFFDKSTVRAATNNFSTGSKLGQGGFGSVYKGELPNGQEIAVKRLSKNSRQGIEEFKNEVVLIANLQHKNLVKLLGCCIEGEERMLIYEYLPNRSLDTLLLDPTKRVVLDWNTRHKIILGIVRGILYLHQDSRLKIIHRDLKCSNVLLDAEMEPKISDFGMARVFQSDQNQERTNRIVGTYGYMPPEYAVFGKFSMKSDVFSFGIILFEIITGKKNNHFLQEDASFSLIGYVWELWRQDRALEIIDPALEQNLAYEEALRCIQVGLLCVQEDAMERPSMLTVLMMFSRETNLPPPKQPAFVFRNIHADTANLTRRSREESYSINEVTISKLTSR